MNTFIKPVDWKVGEIYELVSRLYFYIRGNILIVQACCQALAASKIWRMKKRQSPAGFLLNNCSVKHNGHNHMSPLSCLSWNFNWMCNFLATTLIISYSSRSGWRTFGYPNQYQLCQTTVVNNMYLEIISPITLWTTRVTSI